ncbi:HAD family hydrolase [Salirhabdus sp. Marseille-P4669]|uniref:HAD family hydrolase n=1 Tax=Salirhabdus sp. Marseille-P4669 TaxID=2042310 RepID=UPI000C796124|nr:HAD family hydrolase [Salirhabdus sp. Marseille-P4669]
MIKLIVSDLDGTLFSSGITIDNRDKRAIQTVLLKNKDLQFSVASGRMDVEIKEVLAELGVNGHRISQNGAFVYMDNEERLVANVFPSSLALEVYTYLPKDENSLITVFVEDKGITHHHSNHMNKINEQLFFPLTVDSNIKKRILDLHISKITVGGATGYLKDLEQKVRGQYRDKVDTFISDPHCLDIMPKNISKGTSLQQLIENLHIEPNEIACIGDSYNDISMFALTPYSYCMSHAEERVQNHATYVVRSVADMVDHLIQKKVIGNEESRNL